MTFYSRPLILVTVVVVFIFSAWTFFSLGVRYGNTENNTDTFLTSHLNFHLLSSPIQTVRSDYLFYHLRCGSSCRGIQLVHIPSGKVYKGVISYLFDHTKQKDYALFTDWHSNDFELDDLFDQVTAIVHGNTAVLTFTDTDKQTTPQSIAIDIEN